MKYLLVLLLSFNVLALPKFKYRECVEITQINSDVHIFYKCPNFGEVERYKKIINTYDYVIGLMCEKYITLQINEDNLKGSDKCD